jgi:hypothetical protein
LEPLPIASTPQVKLTWRSGARIVPSSPRRIAQGHALGDGVEARQFAQQEAEMVAAGQDRVGQAFLVDVQGAGGHLVQGRLPDVEDRAVDQQHPLAPDLAAQLAPSRAASSSPPAPPPMITMS